MSQFTGTESGTFDAKKSRLSVPASFRTLLAELGANAIMLRKSEHKPCIEVWPAPVFEAMVNKRIEELDPFSEDFDEQAARLVEQTWRATPDPEGRLVVPRELQALHPLEGELKFRGRIRFFTIWNKADYEADMAAVKAAA